MKVNVLGTKYNPATPQEVREQILLRHEAELVGLGDMKVETA